MQWMRLNIIIAARKYAGLRERQQFWRRSIVVLQRSRGACSLSLGYSGDHAAPIRKRLQQAGLRALTWFTERSLTLRCAFLESAQPSVVSVRSECPTCRCATCEV
eukprot:3115130-Prymnesium_polylepis.1